MWKMHLPRGSCKHSVLWYLLFQWTYMNAELSNRGNKNVPFGLGSLTKVDFNTAANTYCPFAPDMPGTGGSICTLKGNTFIGGSAADLLCASRFMGFHVPKAETKCNDYRDAGCTVYSTNPNVPWVVADFVMSSQQAMSTVLQGRKVNGFGQLDLFLCSNEKCDTVMDVQSVALPRSNDSVWAAGYSQIGQTNIAAPTAYLNATELLLAGSSVRMSRDDLVQDLPAKYNDTQVYEVAYKNNNRSWVLTPPTVLHIGTLSYVANAGNVPWETLRYGTYYAKNLGECVGIISPVHRWMDDHGWNQSHDCGQAKQVFILATYFPQAFLNLTSKSYCVQSFNESGKHYCEYDTFGPLLPEAPNNATWESALLRTHYESQVDDPETLLVYGKTVFVHSEGKNVMDGTQPYLAQVWWEGCERTHEEGIRACRVLVIGRAAILAIDMSDDVVVISDPTDWRLKRIDGLGNQLPDYHTFAANKMLKALTSSYYSQSSMPWCDINPEYQWGRQALIQQWENSPYMDLFNCSMWDSWNFGYVNQGIEFSLVEARPLAKHMQSRWLPLNMNKFRLGFKGDERLLSGAFNDSIQNMVLDAAGKLYEQTSFALSLTDPTITWKGGVSGLALTFVSIVAFNAGRGDLEHLIHRGLFREGKSVLARAGTFTLFALVTFVVISLPAILAIVQDLQTRRNNNSSAKVWWLNEQCFGYGRYIMLGALTMSFSPEFDNFGFGLLWANLVLAVAGAVYVVLRSKYAPNLVIPCCAGQP